MPSCLRTRIPDSTRTMQDWQFASPSTSMRHSKQTPIMQYGARGLPDSGAERKRLMPAASRAAAIVSPSRASIACYAKRK